MKPQNYLYNPTTNPFDKIFRTVTSYCLNDNKFKNIKIKKLDFLEIAQKDNL